MFPVSSYRHWRHWLRKAKSGLQVSVLIPLKECFQPKKGSRHPPWAPIHVATICWRVGVSAQAACLLCLMVTKVIFLPPVSPLEENVRKGGSYQTKSIATNSCQSHLTAVFLLLWKSVIMNRQENQKAAFPLAFEMCFHWLWVSSTSRKSFVSQSGWAWLSRKAVSHRLPFAFSPALHFLQGVTDLPLQDTNVYPKSSAIRAGCSSLIPENKGLIAVFFPFCWAKETWGPLSPKQLNTVGNRELEAQEQLTCRKVIQCTWLIALILAGCCGPLQVISMTLSTLIPLLPTSACLLCVPVLGGRLQVSPLPPFSSSSIHGASATSVLCLGP